MIERVHEHLIEELRTNTRTDTVFVITAIFLNLIILAINSGIAAGGRGTTTTILLFTLVALLRVVNFVAGLGGRDITPDDFEQMIRQGTQLAEGDNIPTFEMFGVRE